MMTTKAVAHTPGPWRAVDHYSDMVSVVDSRGREVVEARCYVGILGSHASARPYIGAAEQAANARLVAAAPELLFELRRVRDIIASVGGCEANLAVIDDVIARATGGAS